MNSRHINEPNEHKSSDINFVLLSELKLIGTANICHFELSVNDWQTVRLYSPFEEISHLLHGETVHPGRANKVYWSTISPENTPSPNESSSR